MWVNLLWGSAFGLFFTFYLGVAYSAWRDHQTTKALFQEPLKVPAAKQDGLVLDIVIPARNEGGKIRRCLESLEHQTFSAFRVWMVNDRSTDETGRIMAEFAQDDDRFTLIEGQEPEPGHVGKVHALLQAVPKLSAPWVLFLDADTWLHPETLARSYALAEAERLDLLSLIPDLECKSFWEHVILPAMIGMISLRFPSRMVNDPNQPNVAIANGQYLWFKYTAYQHIGTHQAVIHSVVEDLNLAQLVKAQGLKLVLANGQPGFKVRMYTNFKELKEGWTKNMYWGSPDPWVGVTLIRVWGLVLLGILPFMGFLGTGWLGMPPWLEAVSWVALLWMLLVTAYTRALYGANALYSIFQPLALCVIGWFLWQSRCLALSKTGVTWKGRQYRLQDSE